jgi:PII-like signaling protein
VDGRARPAQIPVAMGVVGPAKRVRVYVTERVKVGHQSASIALLQLLRAEGAHGATVFRGNAGFGPAGHLHVSHLVDVAQDLPIIVEWIDVPEVVERLLPRIVALVPRGLVTVEATEIVHSSDGG